MKKKIMIINGPNLNALGKRETNIYGSDTLEDIINFTKKETESLGVELFAYQTNSEGEIIDLLYKAYETCDGIVLNAAAYSHYSIAIRDAIASVKLPCIEVHLSNIYARDEFRHTSVISAVCVGVMSGFGKHVYPLAVRALASL